MPTFGGARASGLPAFFLTYVLTSNDAGKCIQKTGTSATTYTVNNSVFSAGDVVTILNNGSAGNITISPGAGVTLRLAGSATTGARTVAPFGMATLYFTAASGAYVSGPGVT